MKRIVLIAVVLAAVIGAGIYWLTTRHLETTDDAQIDAQVIPLSQKSRAM
jgi:multidrug resistance efflux pump